MIDKNHYHIHLGFLQIDASLKKLRSVDIKLARLSHSLPDCMFEVTQFAQVKEEIFTPQPAIYILQLKCAIMYATNSRNTLKIAKLD